MQILPINSLKQDNFKGKINQNKTLERLIKEADQKTLGEFKNLKFIAEKTDDNLIFAFKPEKITNQTSYIDLFVEDVKTTRRELVKTIYFFNRHKADKNLDNPLENFLPKLKDLYRNK